MQDPGYELPGIYLLQGWPNKAKKEGQSCYAPARTVTRMGGVSS
jgi:hypothetical protein